MKDITCCNCQHYLQHYTFDKNRIIRVYCGHCTFSTPKRKRPDSATCEHFAQAAQSETAFVTKEYLTKELLNRVLNMDLLPEHLDTEQVVKIK